jgi:hypothetical protein
MGGEMHHAHVPNNLHQPSTAAAGALVEKEENLIPHTQLKYPTHATQVMA